MHVPHHLWRNRQAAGLALADHLQPWRDQPHSTIVIGLPRGGVAVGAAVAEQLHLPLMSWEVRKITQPEEPEYAVGAIACGGAVVWNPAAIAAGALGDGERRLLVAAAARELERRRLLFGDPSAAQLHGKRLIVVDDGIATGMTVRAALQALRQLGPLELVLAVPVLDRQLLPELQPLVDHLIAVLAVDGLRAVGTFYDDFGQLDDGAVLDLLHQARQRCEPGP
jgi:predicted phosphoribosyltransferase